MHTRCQEIWTFLGFTAVQRIPRHVIGHNFSARKGDLASPSAELVLTLLRGRGFRHYWLIDVECTQCTCQQAVVIAPQPPGKLHRYDSRTLSSRFH